MNSIPALLSIHLLHFYTTGRVTSTPTTRIRLFSVPESCYLRRFVFWIAWTLRLIVYFSVSHMTSELEGPPGPWDKHSHRAPRPLSHAFGEHPVTWFFLQSNKVKHTDDQHDDSDEVIIALSCMTLAKLRSKLHVSGYNKTFYIYI